MPRQDNWTHALEARLGACLMKLRRDRGLSRRDLAAQSGVAHEDIARYEAGEGEIGACELWMLSQALEAPIDSLFPQPESMDVARAIRKRHKAL